MASLSCLALAVLAAAALANPLVDLVAVTSTKEAPHFVSNTGCDCLQTCFESYEEPHHDTSICRIHSSQCGVGGCDCHLALPDKAGEPWDLCSKSNTLQVAWSKAPAFTQGAGASASNAEAKAEASASKAEAKAEAHASKEEAKAQDEVVSARQGNEKALRREVSAVKRAKLYTFFALATSAGLLVVVLALLACAIPSCCRIAKLKRELAEKGHQLLLVDQEKAYMTQRISELGHDIASHKDLVKEQQKISKHLARSVSTAASAAMSRSASQNSRAFMCVLPSDVCGAGSAALCTTNVPSDDNDSIGETLEDAQSVFDRLAPHESNDEGADSHRSFAKRQRATLPVLPFGRNGNSGGSLSESLLASNEFRRSGGEAWSSDEVAGHLATQANASEGKPMLLGAAGASPDTAAAWWGGKGFLTKDVLPKASLFDRALQREERLVAAAGSTTDTFVIHTPAATARGVAGEAAMKTAWGVAGEMALP